MNASVPIVVPLRFNGDTPMIMMTGTSLPGLGTFTVRVLFYGDRYTGTWQHGEVGGHLWGRIEKRTPTTPRTLSLYSVPSPSHLPKIDLIRSSFT